MSEPIYYVEDDTRIVRRVSNGKLVALAYGYGTQDHICRLLNADPLPEDKPARYRVTQVASTTAIYDDVDGHFVASFLGYHPAATSAAHAECDRLNGDVA